jgi:hypothetical protein
LAATAAAGCPPTLYHTTPIKLTASGGILVPLAIDGHTVEALLCTSCPWSSLGEGFVARTGMPKRAARVRYVSIDGNKAEYLAEPKGTTFGALSIEDDYIVDAGSGDEATLGLNLLAYFDVEVDPAAKTISYYGHEKCGRTPKPWANGVSLPFDIDDEVAKVVLDANGRRIRAGFFTGVSHTMMELKIAQHQFGVTPATPGVRPSGSVQFQGGTRSYATYEYVMPQMTLSGIVFRDVPVQLIDFDGYGINLGMHEIESLRFYLAFRERKLYAAPVN